MNVIGHPERFTQNRVIALFRDERTAITGVLSHMDAEPGGVGARWEKHQQQVICLIARTDPS